MDSTTTQTIQKRLRKRAVVEIDPVIAHNLKVFCLLREVPVKKFVSQILKKELDTYKDWIDSFMRLQADSIQEPE